MKKNFYLLKSVKLEKFQLFIPEDAFFINCFELDFDLDHRIAVVFSPNKKKVLGVIEYEKSEC